MFKVSKTMHMMILMTFTIVFVIVYMYYMIRDVRKMYNDVKKQNEQIDTLKKSVDEIQSNITMISTTIQNQVPPEILMSQFMPHMMPPGVPMGHMEQMGFVQMSDMMPISHQQTQSQQQKEDDIESVKTEDIKKLIPDDIEDEIDIDQQTSKNKKQSSVDMKQDNEDVCQETNVHDIDNDIDIDIEKEISSSQQSLNEESLKKLKFDELKDLCKKMNLSAKGTRDTLIERILQANQ